MSFSHFILTRFDYPADYPHLEDRILLFMIYTLPSIENQRCKDFTWVIKSKNPEVAALVAHLPNVIVQSSLEIQPTTEWVITSRLDNDDALSPHYVARIQEQFDDRELLIDSRGFRLNETTNECVKFDYYGDSMPSPFISLIERSAGHRSVIHAKHGDMANHHELVKLNDQLWIQVIHSSNQLMRWFDDRPPVDFPRWFTWQLNRK